MNNKGLTLIEVVAVLVILSIVAIVVTPNIAQNLIDYKNRLTQTQLSTIKSATKNWTADNINKVSCTEDGTSALKVSVQELQADAYLDEKMKNPQGGNFDNSEAFGLVSCTEVKDETSKLDKNYKYVYGGYLDMTDYLKKSSVAYVKDNLSLTTSKITIQTLISNKYVYQSIKDTSNNNINIPTDKVAFVIADDTVSGEYEYRSYLLPPELVDYLVQVQTKTRQNIDKLKDENNLNDIKELGINNANVTDLRLKFDDLGDVKSGYVVFSNTKYELN